MTIRIVALGGTVNPGSTTEQALRLAAAAAGAGGAEVQVFGGAYLSTLAHYGSGAHQKGDGSELVEAVRAAEGQSWCPKCGEYVRDLADDIARAIREGKE